MFDGGAREKGRLPSKAEELIFWVVVSMGGQIWVF